MINKKIIISWLLVVIWAGFIFIMSSYDSEKSDDQSKNVINDILDVSKNKNIDQKEKDEIIEKYNPVIRKISHMYEYFILTILLACTISESCTKNNSNTKNILIVFIIPLLLILLLLGL